MNVKKTFAQFHYKGYTVVTDICTSLNVMDQIGGRFQCNSIVKLVIVNDSCCSGNIKS